MLKYYKTIFNNNNDKYNKALKWSLNPFQNGITYKKIPKQLREEVNKKEKEFGYEIIDKKTNQWTTALGEDLVAETLLKFGENVIKPKQIAHYRPDLETDEYIIEVKTRNWTTSGTAGEKVLGVPYKYMDVPILYEKPLLIILVGYQEYEYSSNGSLDIFSNNINYEIQDEKKISLEKRKKEYNNFIKSMNIHYVKFSDIIKNQKLMALA